MSISNLFQPNNFDLYANSLTLSNDSSFNYVGTMSGPWSTPISVTFILKKSNGIVNLIVKQLQQATVDVAGIGSIVFSPPIPLEFRPSVESVASLFISAPFGLPVNYGSSLFIVQPNGNMTAYSFAGNFNLGTTVGLAPTSTTFWPI